MRDKRSNRDEAVDEAFLADAAEVWKLVDAMPEEMRGKAQAIVEIAWRIGYKSCQKELEEAKGTRQEIGNLLDHWDGMAGDIQQDLKDIESGFYNSVERIRGMVMNAQPPSPPTLCPKCGGKAAESLCVRPLDLHEKKRLAMLPHPAIHPECMACDHPLHQKGK